MEELCVLIRVHTQNVPTESQYTWIDGWTTDLEKIRCSYFDKVDHKIPVEYIPVVEIKIFEKFFYNNFFCLLLIFYIFFEEIIGKSNKLG